MSFNSQNLKRETFLQCLLHIAKTVSSGLYFWFYRISVSWLSVCCIVRKVEGKVPMHVIAV